MMNNSYLNQTGKEDLGGLDYFLRNLHLYLPYSILFVPTVTIGIFSNLLCIVAIAKRRVLRSNPSYIIMLNQTVADLGLNVFVNLSNVLNIFLGKRFFDSHFALCLFLGNFCLMACTTSLINMATLAINRYLCILKPSWYTRAFTKRFTLVYCLVSWLMGLFLCVFNFTGWGRIVYGN